MIAVFALMLSVPSMDALVWLILLVASPDVLRQKWIYIASLRVGLICGVAVAVCIYSPAWPLVLGPEADEWRGFYGYILAFNAIGGTAVTLGAWALSPLLGRPTRVSGEPAQATGPYYMADRGHAVVPAKKRRGRRRLSC